MQIRLVAVATLVLAGTASAQQQTFIIRRGADTVAVEQFTRDANVLTGAITQRNGIRTEYVALLRRNDAIEHIDMTRKAAAGTVTLALDLDDSTVTATMAEGGASEKSSLSSTTKPAPFLVVSFALCEQLARSVKLKPGESVRRLALRMGSADTATATITRFHADSISIAMADVGVKLALNAKGDVVGGTHQTQPWIVERKP